MDPVYLDNNATTRLDPRVLEAMLPYFGDEYGNAASRNHAFGKRARAAVETARRQVAQLIGAKGHEIIWTSGATEADNLAIKGIPRAYAAKGRHVVTSPVEHKAVIDSCRFLQREGCEVTYVDVDSTGRVDPSVVAAAIRDDTVLVTLMLANNELGTVSPIAEIGRICKARKVLFHTDATQAVGKLPIDVEAMGVDLLSLSGHKLHGPKGVGALFVRSKRPRVRCEALQHGGGHEEGLRSGTLNVPGIVGLGQACEIAAAEMAEESTRTASLRDRLWAGLQSGLTDLQRNGHPSECLPNTLNVSFGQVRADMLIFSLPDVAISSGSACTTSSLEPSYVLRALGLDEATAYGSIRFSLGRYNTVEEIDRVIPRVVETIGRLRKLRPQTGSDRPDEIFTLD